MTCCSLASARGRSPQLLGFSTGDSTRITTALAEIARNALVYGRGGTVAFFIQDEQQGSQTGMGLGITGSRALVDRFQIESAPGAGTRVLMSKMLPRSGRGSGPPTSRA